jgi:hypothetical protein
MDKGKGGVAMTDFSAFFQAVAIEARCRLRWAGVNDETRRIKVKNVHRLSIPYVEQGTMTCVFDPTGLNPPPYPQFGQEYIDLETIWIGMHRYLRIGYGPNVNALAVASGD